MANEAVCLELPRVIKRYDVYEDIAITKGTLLKLSGDNLVAPSTGADVFIGIATEEKAADTGQDIAVALDGVYDIKCNNAVEVTLGAIVVLSGPNIIKNAAEADLVLGKVVGKAEEAGSVNEVIRVRVGAI